MASSVYVGLGANLGEAKQVVQEASRQVARLGSGARLSSLYRSAPQGGVSQPPYCNAVMSLNTVWSPHQLLYLLRVIERRFGRARRERWGPRTLDLDLLMFEDWIIQTPTMTVPHSRLAERRFVLEPLVELNPDLVLPNGAMAKELLKWVEWQEVERW